MYFGNLAKILIATIPVPKIGFLQGHLSAQCSGIPKPWEGVFSSLHKS
jgi:hypothetical protein